MSVFYLEDHRQQVHQSNCVVSNKKALEGSQVVEERIGLREVLADRYYIDVTSLAHAEGRSRGQDKLSSALFLDPATILFFSVPSTSTSSFSSPLYQKKRKCAHVVIKVVTSVSWRFILESLCRLPVDGMGSFSGEMIVYLRMCLHHL